MRNYKLLSAALLTFVAFGANAEGIADRHSEAAFADQAVANPYSGTHTVLRGQAVNKTNIQEELVANPYSGEQVVLRGQVIANDQEV